MTGAEQVISEALRYTKNGEEAIEFLAEHGFSVIPTAAVRTQEGRSLEYDPDSLEARYVNVAAEARSLRAENEHLRFRTQGPDHAGHAVYRDDATGSRFCVDCQAFLASGAGEGET